MTGLVAVVNANKDLSVAVNVIAPKGQPPSGCSLDYNGKFQLTLYAAGDEKPNYQKSPCDNNETLVATLAGGVLKDAKNRDGYIASNYQLQFDSPPQPDAIYTGGFAICGNNSLALGSSTLFSRCLSGKFYNLYDRPWALQCDWTEIVAMPCAAGNGKIGGDVSNPKVIGGSSTAATLTSTLGDGQPRVLPTRVPIAVCQIGDGQIQFHTTPCTTVATTSSPRPIPQISTSQPQASIFPSTKSSQHSPSATSLSPHSSSAISRGQSLTLINTSSAPRISSDIRPPATQTTDSQSQPSKVTSNPSNAVTAGTVKKDFDATIAFIAVLLAAAHCLY